ncbi:MAG: NfeD family protein [Xanthobacteraceae bacterium]
MTSMFATLGSWNWLILGLVLIGVEVLAPGVFMLWLGLAALLVGLLSFAIDMHWQMQVLLFAVFAAIAVPIWRNLARRGNRETSNPFLNRRNDALVGRVFTLEKPIQDGSGTVRIDDTIWRVNGPDAPAGSRIRVVKADGATLTVAAE